MPSSKQHTCMLVLSKRRALGHSFAGECCGHPQLALAHLSTVVLSSVRYRFSSRFTEQHLLAACGIHGASLLLLVLCNARNHADSTHLSNTKTACKMKQTFPSGLLGQAMRATPF